MARAGLVRKAFFVDPRDLRRARRALGAATDAEAIRTSLTQAAEMADFWRFMRRTHGRVKPGTFER